MKIKDERTCKFKDVRLPKAFKTKWLKALRSGDYLQTDGRLYYAQANNDKGGYCCLGVACRITGNTMEELNNKTFPSELTNSKIPKLLLEIDQLMYDSNGILARLAIMNDNGKSFKQIAAYIERYL